MINKRQVAKRLRKRIEIRYGPDELIHTGYSGNISASGLMVKTIRVYGSGTILNIEMHFPSGIIFAKARVEWARQGSMSLISTGRIGMGLRFLETPAELIEMIAGSIER